MDEGFYFLAGQVEGVGDFVFEELPCRIIQLAFENRQFLDLAPVIERTYDGRYVDDTAFFKEIEIDLVAQFPVRRYGFEVFRNQVEGPAGLFRRDNRPDAEFLGLVTGTMTVMSETAR